MAIIAAVFIGALLLGDRLASPAELRRRFYQGGLGVTLLLFTLAISGLAFPGDGFDFFTSGAAPDEAGLREVGEKAVEKSIFIAASGFILLMGGLIRADRWPTSHLGVMVGGLLLLTYGALQEFESGASIYTLASQFLGTEAGPVRNITYALVLALGSLGLFVFGYNHWDKPATTPEAASTAA
jgi:hypothetical protein